MSTAIDRLRAHCEERRQGRPLVVFLDYDGTLVPIAPRPEQATLSAQTRRRLATVLSNTTVKAVVVSGRGRRFLTEQLGSLPLAIVAEHGAYLREFKADWQKLAALDEDVRREAEGLFQEWEKRFAATLIERKEQSLAWHYRSAEGVVSPCLKELHTLLSSRCGPKADILCGKAILEVRPYTVNKGAFVRSYFAKSDPTSVLSMAIGDDRTDEDMFRAVLAVDGVAVKVGEEPTVAPFRLSDCHAVLELLDRLTEPAS